MILATAPFLLWVYVQEAPQSQTLSSLPETKALKSKVNHDKRVNQRLRQLDEKIIWEEAKVTVDNFHLAPDVANVSERTRRAQALERSVEFVLVDQFEERQAIEPESQIDRILVLEEKIDHEIWNEQLDQDLQANERAAYVKKFVENAREGGYSVRVDKDMRVKSVKKIRRTY